MWVNPDLGEYDELNVEFSERSRSDHAVLTWHMPVSVTCTLEPRIPKVGEAAKAYVAEVGQRIAGLPRAFESPEDVERVGEQLQTILDELWEEHACVPNRTKHSKSWWNEECSKSAREIRRIRQARLDATARRRALSRDDGNPAARAERRKLDEEAGKLDRLLQIVQRELKAAARRAKRQFFGEIMTDTHPQKIWDMVHWTKPRRLNVSASLVNQNGESADSGADDLCQAFQQQFTPANPRPADPGLLDEIPQQPERDFKPISTFEITEQLQTTSNTSVPGPDHLSWFWLKRVVEDNAEVLLFLRPFYNACVQHGVFPAIFKRSCTVVIPKPNKSDYSKAKAYRPIVLLNCLGKLLEKVIARRLQFDAQKFNLLHPCQFGGAIQKSTIDAGVQLIHNIRQAWTHGLTSTALLLDVSQFYPSINHTSMTGILRKQGFAPVLCTFFENYLVGRQTRFAFNGRLMAPTDFNVGVGQGSALSPILSGLYIAPVIHCQSPVLCGRRTHLLRCTSGAWGARSDPGPAQLRGHRRGVQKPPRRSAAAGTQH